MDGPTATEFHTAAAGVDVLAMADECKAQGNAAFKEGRYELAAQHFSAAIALDGSNAVLFSNRSGAYASLGSYWEALADAEKAIALRPDWSKGFSRKGAALYGLGRYAEALNTYDAGLAVEPGSQQMGQVWIRVVGNWRFGVEQGSGSCRVAVGGGGDMCVELIGAGAGGARG